MWKSSIFVPSSSFLLYCFILTLVTNCLERPRSFNLMWKRLNYWALTSGKRMDPVDMVYVEDLTDWGGDIQSFQFMAWNVPLVQNMNRIHQLCQSSLYPRGSKKEDGVAKWWKCWRRVNPKRGMECGGPGERQTHPGNDTGKWFRSLGPGDARF